MGGRGTFAVGNMVEYTYEKIGEIEGVKVLAGLNGKHGLPEESHRSRAYIKLDHNGFFRMMRIYDRDHYLTFELAYHVEPNLDKSKKPILHYHLYDRDFNRTVAIKATKAMRRHFKKYLKGIKL
ncbi:MAG: hypothetical protein Q4B23_00915 [Helcococcus sp.]|nr:hypothetical protein [Helcococcus sp.]